MTNKVRAYHLASTDDQEKGNLNAKQIYKDFAAAHNFKIDEFYTDSKAIKALGGSALLRLLNNCSCDDVLLIKDTSVFNALDTEAWQPLASKVQDKQLRVVVIEIPRTWQQITGSDGNEDDSTVSHLLIELLAGIAISAKNNKKRLQTAGIYKAKLAGKYKGRKPDTDQYRSIIQCLSEGMTYKEIEASLGCSSRTITKAKKWQNATLES